MDKPFVKKVVSRHVANADAVVVEVGLGGRYGKMKLLDPMKSQLGFNYVLWSDNDIKTLPMVLTKGRECRIEVWSPNQEPGRHIAKNIHVYIEEVKVSEVSEEKQDATNTSI